MAKVLSIDPSFTTTGWAFFDGGAPVNIGKFKTNPKDGSAVRLREIVYALEQLIESLEPELILVELTSGKINVGRHGGGGAGIGKYGMAVGAAFVVCAMLRSFDAVIGVNENDWTRRVPKHLRIQAMKDRFSLYNAQCLSNAFFDDGGDIGDALGLWCWWYAEQLLQKAEQGYDRSLITMQ